MNENGILTLTIEAKDENLEKVLSFVDAKMEEMGCAFKQINQVDLVLEEAFVNVAHYAYQENGYATIELEEKDTGLAITLIDEGKEFNPIEKEDPDITQNADDRQIGGLGIFLVKKLMTSVSYERKENKNILRMYKDFSI